MLRAPRVLLIGLDAAEPSLLRAWARNGHMPALRRVMDSGVSTSLGSLARHFPDQVWPALYSSCNPAQIPAPFFISPHREHSGCEVVTNMAAAREPFWQTAARHGRRCVVIDPPKVGLLPPQGGVQLTGWGPHATLEPLVSQPRELAARVTRTGATRSIHATITAAARASTPACAMPCCAASRCAGASSSI